MNTALAGPPAPGVLIDGKGPAHAARDMTDPPIVVLNLRPPAKGAETS